MKNYIIIILFFLSNNAFAQSANQAEDKKLYLDGNVTYYVLPGQDNLTTPVAGITYENLYFEGRYNYEAEDAGSLWFGRIFNYENSIEMEIIPMAGGIFGEVEGAAPGLELDATWKKVNFYIEAEYVFDFDTRDNNFFYSWSEFTYGFSDWLRAGIAASRTRLYSSSVEIDRGPFVAFSYDKYTASCAALNIDDDPIVVINMSVTL